MWREIGRGGGGAEEIGGADQEGNKREEGEAAGEVFVQRKR